MRKSFSSVVILMAFTLVLAGISYGQVHFTPLANQGQPALAVVIQAATIEAVPLVADDEIGVFDGDLCVGASVVIDPLWTNPVLVTAVQEDAGQGFQGYTVGNAMTYKLWSNAGPFETEAVATYNTGDGTFPDANIVPIVDVATLAANAPAAAVLEVNITDHDFGQVAPNATVTQAVTFSNTGVSN